MKYTKRAIAVLLLFSMVLTSSTFTTACSASKAQKVTMGEWLAMINASFGMESYLSEEPYFSEITAENPYFGTVQIAAEWEVIDPESELNLEKYVTWKEGLVTLVNAGAFLQENATEEEKISYGIKYFDDSIQEKKLEKEIDFENAAKLLTIAQQKWANLTYDEAVEEVTYAEGVLDYSQGEQAITDYRIDENGNLFLSAEKAARISEGDVFVLGGNEQNFGSTAYKAEAVETVGDEVKITVTSDIPLEEVLEELYIAETLVPNSDNTVIRDGNGNVIYAGNNTGLAQSKTDSESLSGLVYRNNEARALTKVKSAAVKTTFDVGDFKVSLNYKLDGNLDLSATIESNNLLNVPKTSTQKLKGTVGVAISNLSVTPKFDWGRKEASVRVNYKKTDTFSLKYSGAIKDLVVAPYNNGNGKYLTNILKAKLKDKNAKGNGAKTIKICSLEVYSVALARVCLDVNLKISAEGEATITITENSTKGMEFKNGNLRFISDVNKDEQVDLKGKIEGTISIGPALYTIGLKKCIIGASLTGGVGAKAGLTIKLADNENHLLESADMSDIAPYTVEAVDFQITATGKDIETIAKNLGYTYKSEQEYVELHTDKCLDIKVYGIIRFELSASICKDLLGDKVSLSKEFLGEDNGTFAHIHIDNFETAKTAFGGGAGEDLCTLQYTPFGDSEEEETEETSEITVGTEFTGVSGDSLTLSEMSIALEIGDVYTIAIEEIPEAYNMSDIIFTMENEEVATVDRNGKIRALSSGSTMLTVSTGDGEYKAYCAVMVLMEQEEKVL